MLPTEVTPPRDAPAVEQEFAVAYDYDTVDRDLEQLGMTVSRLPAEAANRSSRHRR